MLIKIAIKVYVKIFHACKLLHRLYKKPPEATEINKERSLTMGPKTIFFFFFFKAASLAYGSSQTRDQIGAVAFGLYHSSQQGWILNPLSETRDQNCILIHASQIHFCWAMTGTPKSYASIDLLKTDGWYGWFFDFFFFFFFF